MIKVQVSNVVYDLEDIPVDQAPSSELTLEINIDSGKYEKEDIDEIVSDEISNSTGFCHLGFDYKIIND